MDKCIDGFEEWLVQELAEHHENNDKDMVKHLTANGYIMQNAWKACWQYRRSEIDDYFKNKHDLAGTLANHRQLIAEAEGK